MKDADFVGRAGTPGHGNYLVLYIRVSHGVITESRFQTYGCPAAIASGSWIAEWIIGKSLEQLNQLAPEMVDTGLGGLPVGKDHCPVLAANAVRHIVEQAVN